MKKIITTILVIAVLLSSVVVPTSTAKATSLPIDPAQIAKDDQVITDEDVSDIPDDSDSDEVSDDSDNDEVSDEPEKTEKSKPKKNQFKNIDRNCKGCIITNTVSYNKKGNIVWKIKVKHAYHEKVEISVRNKLYIKNGSKTVKIKTKWNKGGYMTLKRGESKTKSIIVKKSKVKGKKLDLANCCDVENWVTAVFGP